MTHLTKLSEDCSTNLTDDGVTCREGRGEEEGRGGEEWITTASHLTLDCVALPGCGTCSEQENEKCHQQSQFCSF